MPGACRAEAARTRSPGVPELVRRPGASGTAAFAGLPTGERGLGPSASSRPRGTRRKLCEAVRRSHEPRRTNSSIRRALELHVQAERAALAAAKDTGKLTEARCPMLARHLRAERMAVAAVAVEEAKQRGQPEAPTAEAAAPSAAGTAALAARIRAAPRAERRALVEALPKATRLELEQHLLAARSVSCGAAGAAGAAGGPAGDGARKV